MRFTGWAVDLLCDVNPEYYEGKTKALYVWCNKVIYRCVVSRMIWYELFSQMLEKHGFAINPHDFCIANATIDGTQCTIIWYINDTKNIPRQAIRLHWLNRHVRKPFRYYVGLVRSKARSPRHAPRIPWRRHSHGPHAIVPSECDHQEWPADHQTAPTPAATSLLHIRAASPPLPQDRARTFHSVLAKLIYPSTQARTDILLPLGFLCRHVSASTKQDEQKLFRLLAYLLGTIDLKYRLVANSLDSFSTWVDASFAIHGGMRSHTGVVISFDCSGLICKLKMQSINTKSSTKAELVGASDYLPNTLFVKMLWKHMDIQSRKPFSTKITRAQSKWKEPHQHSLFVYHRSRETPIHHDRALPNRDHACRFLHQTTTRFPLPYFPFPPPW
jgi:hypothetical protein